MAKVKLQVWGYRCERCAHEWVPREQNEPRVCPKCKSPYWNLPRKEKRSAELTEVTSSHKNTENKPKKA